MTVFVKYAAVFALLLGSRLVSAADVYVYTEHYPPYSYIDENGEVAGTATDLVRQVMDESGLDYELRLVPWNRAYTLATQLDNVLVYSILHTDERAALFHWLAPVLETNLYLYGRAGEKAGFKPELLRDGKLSGACVIGDVACGLLRELGVPEDKIIQAPDTYRGEEKLVRMKRADVFIAQESYQGLLPNADRDRSPFAKFMKLEKQQQFCLAAGHQVRPDIVAAMTAAYERLMAAGKYRPLHMAGPGAGNGAPPEG